MNQKMLFGSAAVVIALSAAAATPANAVVTTFATFSALTTDNIYFKNSRSNGVGNSATLYSISKPTATTPGSVAVRFSFINEDAVLDEAVSNVNAIFTLNGTVVKTPATKVAGGYLLQSGLSGSFSLVSTSAITVGTTQYSAGSNLLTGTFSGGDIFGKNSQGSIGIDNASLDALVYTSDFVTFDPTANLDMSVALTAISPILGEMLGGNYALKTFKSDSSGEFSADPAPRSNATPEPATWALMLLGVGFVGFAARRRAIGQAAIL